MRRFFIGSVGDPNEGYSKINLERCEKYHAHVMHKDTKCKGPFDDIKPTDIFFLKFEEKLLAFGEVLETKKLEDEGIDIDNGWTWHVVVKEWYWVNPNKVMNYGVKFNQIGGFVYDTIKEVKLDYGINKLREFNINNALYKQVINEFEMDKIIKLLKNNHNLILTGAPGTGKTYLAKEIAKAMGCTDDEIGFVQFHPSYDYTDFVEGLRPKDDNNQVGFERMDGVFKEFCKKALRNLKDSQKSKVELARDNAIVNLLSDFIAEAKELQTIFHTNTKGVDFLVYDYAKSKLKIRIPQNEKANDIRVSISELKELLEKMPTIESGADTKAFFNRKYRLQEDTYLASLYLLLKDKVPTYTETQQVEKKNFVFIIDEINRGEISKIFGELFFSIDPGYRGVDENGKPKGLVQTQYQNLVEDDDDFKKGFFVPENVYIIGTMNDIDRSVESMDFAFRRRFAFKEIKADKNIGMLDELGGLKGKAEKKMSALNEAISKISGLNSAYHIGGAYFLKLKNYDNNFDELWANHFDGLLREYLRGRRQEEIEKDMKNLKQAYDSAN